jgi:tetratricopeptide (TPR) repeat protein
MRLPITVLLSLSLSLPLSADPAHGHSDHSAHDLGSVEFPSSCKPEVQASFSRGVAMLHSFWYDEAERTFRDVAARDPQCGMAWWGVAMSNYHPIWAAPTGAELANGREAAAKAREIGAKTDREKAYIAAINAYYDEADTVDHPTRARRFGTAMESVTTRFPDDEEARIFHALTLLARGMASPADKTYADQKKAAETLNALLPKMPNHPGISHYIIHSFDYPALAHLALPAAKAYAKIAPASAHALHMPSHIFVRMGMWQETIDSNLASAEAGRAFAAKHKPGSTSWDQLHAWDYLAYAYLQRGEVEKVKDLVDALPLVKSIDTDNFAGYYALAAIPVRYALERRRWAEAAALTPTPPTLAWQNSPYAEALVYFGRAVGAARSGNPKRARQDAEKLSSLRQVLVNQKNTYWAEQVDIQRKLADGWIARAEGRTTDALTLLSAAADAEDATEKHPVTPGAVVPAREMLAELLMELGRTDEALAAYELTLKDSPNRLNALAGAAGAARLTGRREEAAKYYTAAAGLLDQPSRERTALTAVHGH